MPTANRMSVQCPRCGNQFEATVNSLIDPAQDPEAKFRLLNGQINAVQCPRCGAVFSVPTPVVYHDADKELLITYIPIELNLPKDRQERIVGDLIREVTNSLPQEKRKGYLFRPAQALTLQGLIDQVLQADGVTPEMMEAQRAKLKLVESLIQASEDDLPGLVQEHDAEIDAQFFQIMTLVAQRYLQEGRADLAQHVLVVQSAVVEHSTAGRELIAQSEQQEQTVTEVAEAVRALGQGAQRSDFMNLAIEYADDTERLQALVGLVRPVFDYQFFQDLTVKIAEAPAAERERLENMRDLLLQFTTAIDQQTQMAVQQSAEVLQAILADPNPDELIRANLGLIDDTFMAVLAANIQEAERQSDIASSARLKDVYNRVVGILRENMQPELRFINDVLSAPTADEARALIAENAATYGEGLLDMLESVEAMMAQRGDQALMQRLAFVREEAERALG